MKSSENQQLWCEFCKLSWFEKTYICCSWKKKPHLCQTCGVSFANKGNLTKHIAAVHKGIKRDQWKTGKNKLSQIANNQWSARHIESFFNLQEKKAKMTEKCVSFDF